MPAAAAPPLAQVLDRPLEQQPTLESVVVERHGRIVYERYFHGARRETRVEVFSVTKSVVSMLVGIAVGDGKLRLDARVVSLLRDQVPHDVDPRVRRITVRDLLTMRSGWTDARGGLSDDWVQTLLARHPSFEPGIRFQYDNGSPHLLSAILTRTTHGSAAAFARRRLFGPLGIRRAVWPADGQGVTWGYTGLRLRPRDLAKLGELYLHGGRWHGRQLVPRAWVRASTRDQVRLPRAPVGYGYLWWILHGREAGFAALGFGGQAVVVHPSLDLVVVVTAGGTDAGGAGSQTWQLVDRLVLAQLR